MSGAVIAFASEEALGVFVGDLRVFECTHERDGMVGAPTDAEVARGVAVCLGDSVARCQNRRLASRRPVRCTVAT